jgi:hypothetical protein
MKRYWIVVYLLLAVGLQIVAFGQGIDWEKAKAEALADEEGSRADAASPNAAAASPQVTAAYERYYISALAQRSSAFAWQAFASKVIFWMVIFLVVSGIAFSAAQFWVGIRRGSPETAQEIELSLNAVKIRSQFLGVITLALSLGFFYLYLSTVYPITSVRAPDATADRK